MEEEWKAAMAALRDLQVTANRLCGEAAQDKAKAETYENAVARADGLRAGIHALNETKQDARRTPDDDQP
jgi:phage host-nuclease inhibitor protein Gam